MILKKLNIAGKLAQYFISSKLTFAFILACASLGIVAVLLTPREENPQIIVPSAQVRIVWPGASAEEVEELIVRPLEGIVQQISGVDHTYAAAMNSVGVLAVQFEVGQDKERSLVKLYDRVLGQRDRFPAGSGLPVIRSLDVDDIPVVTFTFASEKYSDYALRRFADRLMDGIRSLPDVSDVYVKGGSEREIRIELEPEKVQSYGLTLVQVRSMILAGNVSAPLGSVVQNGENRNVFMDGFIISANELERLIVGIYRERPIYLGDLGRVVDGPPEERSQLSRFAYGPAEPRFDKYQQPEVPAVTLAIAKKPGTNAVFVANDVIKRVNMMKEQFIPSDVDVVVTRNDGEKADAAVNLLIEHLGIAVFAVFLVTVLFLGLKEAMIVGFTVPLILALTLGADYLFGPTINRITLYALILSLGMLVDAAIVVIENIHRRYRHVGHHNSVDLAVDATNEIGNPTNLATLAVIIVFLSMSVLTGMPEQYFFPVMFNVPVAMASSLLIAYIVVPWATNRWLKPEPFSEGSQVHGNGLTRILHVFKKILTIIIDRPRTYKWVYIVSVLLVSLSVFMPLWQFIRPAGIEGPQSWFGVEMAMLPKDNKNTFNITIDLPETSPVEQTDRLAREIGIVLRQIPEVINYQTWIGYAGVTDFNGMLRGTSAKTGPNVAEIRVNLTNKKDRDSSSIEIVRDWRPKVLEVAERFPGTTVQLVEDPPGPPLRSTVLAEIYGPDPEQLRFLSEKVKTVFWNTYDMAEVNDSEAADVFRYRLVPDKEKAMLSGLTAAEIAVAANRLIDGEVIGSAHIKGEKTPVPIRFETPRRYEVKPEHLERIQLTNRYGQKIPLSEVVKVEPDFVDRTILHKDNERVTFVGGELRSTAQVYAVLALDKKLNGMEVPDGGRMTTGNLGLIDESPETISGYRLLWDGEMRMTMDIYRELFTAFSLSLMVIYLMLVAYYKSFSLPLIAMASIPLGVAGVFPGHLIMGQQFSAASIIGLLALASVVIRNSLLIIDFTLHYILDGKPVKEAVVTAVEMRTRPIILTALAVVLGVAIMLTDPVFGGLAISLIFGTTISTALTLIVIPLMLYMNLARKEK
jgi:multidrug efflux pump subunit AcrB